jgi:plastocyanin
VAVRPRVVMSVAVLLVTVLVLGSVASAATFRVRGKLTDSGYRWRPKTLSVPSGSRVVWKIVEGTHNVTSISNNWNKNSGNIGSGGSTAFTFNGGGTYRYRCTLHSTLSSGKCNGMCGKVVVG